MKKLLIVLILFSFVAIAQQKGTNSSVVFTINTNEIVGENSEFWKAAGSDYLFNHVTKPSGQSMLNRMKSTQSHTYLRTHHTFVQDKKKGILRGQNVYSEDKNGNPIYDFSNVNKVLGEYVKRGLKPIVEYDYLPKLLEQKSESLSKGNDEGMKMRNTGPNDWKKWSDLMKAATKNFIDEFGHEEVRSWYFEVWNEPDGWPLDQMDTFYKMYDVFVDAVTSVDSELKVGGPACYHEYFLRPFLNHVVNGTNYVTGEKGTRIDFISYHIYGLSGKWLNSAPHLQPQVQRFSQSVLWLKRLMKEFPDLKGTELHINEWGMASNFWRKLEDHPDLVYRNNEESALFLVKLVNSLYQIEDNYNFPTSMLLYWGFVGEADAEKLFLGQRELLTGGNIPKPIQTGFEMLAKLKEYRIKVGCNKKDNRFGILATQSASKNISFIAYNYEEDEHGKNAIDSVLIQIKDLKPNTTYKFVETLMDDSHNNTFSAWKKQGEPQYSETLDLAPIKEAGCLTPTSNYEIKSNKNGELDLKLDLKTHSMKLIELNEKK
ncbi:GH39 family glycosyl hydrolase [Marinifilum caeruleilacunae]|uniref:Glycosyl hydrolases family 39 N-terminal catalytic domain-containing protein n=1 Tax=Marinifilum caeruleilacunae TaxID=2499076 RepID=A0ABX1WZ46_9BACT|nr:hypothetical protein [Marinifilum caeruleilacunae]NOU61292.1 hypothetical protein [Marinifilum caeruleilacunae]